MSKSAVSAELSEPMHMLALLFWTNRMPDEAAGIPGYFKGSSYWSADGADAYAPGDVWRWVYQRTAAGAQRSRPADADYERRMREFMRSRGIPEQTIEANLKIARSALGMDAQ